MSVPPGERPLAQHRAARDRRLLRIGIGALAFLAITGLAIGVSLGSGTPEAGPVAGVEPPAPVVAEALPAPRVESVDAVAPCENDAVLGALQAGDPGAVVAAFGGAQAFRAHVAAGSAPCIPLDDARWPWVVVNKQRPLAPAEFRPASIASPANVAIQDRALQADAAQALDRLTAAAEAEGAGRIALNSGFRSYETQISSFGAQVQSRGVEAAEEVSARPGHSEHQTGLAADVVACDGSSCGTLGDFGATGQGAWTAQNAWRFGWIVRYEAGATGTTGYAAEPWHLRYIGPELAEAYHAGGYHTLEEFFGLPPAPDYVH